LKALSWLGVIHGCPVQFWRTELNAMCGMRLLAERYDANRASPYIKPKNIRHGLT
jgi:hypothetical protein